MSKGVKLLFPPFTWVSLKLGVQEDKNKRRWTANERRQLRNGTMKELPNERA